MSPVFGQRLAFPTMPLSSAKLDSAGVVDRPRQRGTAFA